MTARKTYHNVCGRKECNEKFTSYFPFQKYCSPSCYSLDNRRYSNKNISGAKKAPNTVCPKCGKAFHKKDIDEKVRRNFCSKCKDTMIRTGLLNRAGSEYTW